MLNKKEREIFIKKFKSHRTQAVIKLAFAEFDRKGDCYTSFKTYFDTAMDVPRADKKRKPGRVLRHIKHLIKIGFLKADPLDGLKLNTRFTPKK